MLTAFMAATLTAVSVPFTASAEEETKEVSIRVEGINSCIFDDTVNVPADSETVMDALVYASDYYSDYFIIYSKMGSYGEYIYKINNDNEGTFGGYDGWMYTVNGVAPSVGVADYEVKDGDDILLYYSGSMDMQFPTYTLDAENGIIKFTSMDTVYDADWNATVVEQPVKELNVTLSQDEKNYSFVTDENGEIALAENNIAIGKYNIEYSKYAENGAPVALRSRQNEEVEIKYAGVMGDANCDGAVDAVDASVVLTAYANTSTSKPSGLSSVQKILADVDMDRNVDALDASNILAFYAYKASEKNPVNDIMTFLENKKK